MRPAFRDRTLIYFDADGTPVPTRLLQPDEELGLHLPLFLFVRNRFAIPGAEVRKGMPPAAAHLVKLFAQKASREQLAEPAQAALKRARSTAEDLGLPLAKRVRGYSHGMKRQLVFAAAMAPNAPLLPIWCSAPTGPASPSPRRRTGSSARCVSDPGRCANIWG